MLVGPDDMMAAFKRKTEILKSSGNMYWVRCQFGDFCKKENIWGLFTLRVNIGDCDVANSWVPSKRQIKEISNGMLMYSQTFSRNKALL